MNYSINIDLTGPYTKKGKDSEKRTTRIARLGRKERRGKDSEPRGKYSEGRTAR